MAIGSRDAGVALLSESDEVSRENYSRSAVSRFYYAAYQAMTALLLYERQEPPVVGGVQRESWSHEVTPQMVLENLGRVVPNRKDRYDFRRRLRELYNARVYADYSGSIPPRREWVVTALKDANFLIKVARNILPEEAE
jgi:uncharacterized protein (UPF0332 family)